MAGSISKEALLKITGDSRSAEEALTRIDVRYDELKAKIKDEKLVPQLDKAKALAQAAVLREELKKELKVTADVSVSPRGGRLLSRLFGNGVAGGGLGGGGLPGGVTAALIGVPAVEAALPLVVGLVSGIAAAGAGLGAFGILAAGTFSQLKQDVTLYQAAWDKLNQAQNIEAVRQANFAADPTKGNKAALVSAQKAVVTAQTNLRATSMGMGQDAGPAAAAINTLRLAYDKLSASLQPLTFKVITDAVKAVGTFLPNLAPFAQAGGKAIDDLLGKVNTFFASADFKKWLDKFLPLVGPAIGALGSGFGKVAVSVGKLFTLMSSHDVVHAINTTFDAINGIINGTNNFVLTLMSNWDRMTGAFAQGWQNIQSFLGGGSPSGPSVANLPSSLGNLGNLNLTGLSGFNTSASGPGGGKIGHLASGGYGSGLTLVGESGPELMNLPSGTRVHSHAQTMRMLSAAAQGGWSGGRGGGGPAVVLQVGGGSGLDRLFAQWLRNNTRLLGGGGPNSVQIAWGQTH